jgi:hypothetical protein
MAFIPRTDITSTIRKPFGVDRCLSVPSADEPTSPFVLDSRMANVEQSAQAAGRARLRNSTTVFLVGNIEPTMEWYKRLGFVSEYYPPGFAILRRDEIQIFVQQQPGYVAPDDPGRRERHAWNVYIITDNVEALYDEYSSLPGVRISRPLCPQDYGMKEFDVTDLNGHRLVFAQPIPTSNGKVQ